MTRAAPEELYNWKNFENYIAFITKDEIDDFSSKQSFEEESLSSIMTMKFLQWKPISNLPHVPADIIRHFEGQINETLDLMRLKTLKLLFVDQETKHDCKWL